MTVTKRHIKLVKVDVNKNINNWYEMIENDNGTLTVKHGRVESFKKCRTKNHSLSKWYEILNKILKKGYKIVMTQDDIDNIDNIEVSNESLNELKRQIVIDYRISPEDVSMRQIDIAESILDKIENKIKENNITKSLIDEINSLLLDIYTILPRRMDDVSKNLINAISNVYYTDILDLKRLIFNEKRFINFVKKQKEIINKISKIESMSSSVESK